MQKVYEEVVEDNCQLGELTKLAYKDIILLINSNFSVDKVMLGLVCNVKSLNCPKGNCKVAFYRLRNKFAQHSASSLFKLKCEFHNGKLDPAKTNPD